MKLQITFKVDVDWQDGVYGGVYGDPLTSVRLQERIELSVAQAVENAMYFDAKDGHTHDMSEEISILMDGEVSAEFID